MTNAFLHQICYSYLVFHHTVSIHHTVINNYYKQYLYFKRDILCPWKENPVSSLCPILVPKALINNLFPCDKIAVNKLYGPVFVIHDLRSRVLRRDSLLFGVCSDLASAIFNLKPKYARMCPLSHEIQWLGLHLVEY